MVSYVARVAFVIALVPPCTEQCMCLTEGLYWELCLCSPHLRWTPQPRGAVVVSSRVMEQLRLRVLLYSYHFGSLKMYGLLLPNSLMSSVMLS